MNQTIYLASDYDGTFKQGSIRDEDKEAIRRFRSRGGRFGLVTGRSLSMLEQEFARSDMQMDFIIACTGAVIFDQDLNVIFKKPMDTATAWELETEMERRPAGLCGMASLRQAQPPLPAPVPGRFPGPQPGRASPVSQGGGGAGWGYHLHVSAGI